MNCHRVPVRVRHGGHPTAGEVQRFDNEFSACFSELVDRLIERKLGLFAEAAVTLRML